VGVRLGEHLTRENIRVRDLMFEWDSNNDNKITAVEFRTNVRMMLKNVDSKSLDAFFATCVRAHPCELIRASSSARAVSPCVMCSLLCQLPCGRRPSLTHRLRALVACCCAFAFQH
jgi:hypothetical protein